MLRTEATLPVLAAAEGSSDSGRKQTTVKEEERARESQWVPHPGWQRAAVRRWAPGPRASGDTPAQYHMRSGTEGHGNGGFSEEAFNSFGTVCARC